MIALHHSFRRAKLTARRSGGRAAGGLSRLARTTGLLTLRENVRADVTRDDPRSDEFSAAREMPRYAVLAGYVRILGGTPTVLDIRCGTGILAAHLHGSGVRQYLGVDPDASALERAQRHAGAGYRFMPGTVDDVDGRRFDVVVLNETLTAHRSPARVLDAVADVLASNGHVLVSVARCRGDRAAWRAVRARYLVVDTVAVGCGGNPLARRGWRVAMLRSRQLRSATATTTR